MKRICIWIKNYNNWDDFIAKFNEIIKVIQGHSFYSKNNVDGTKTSLHSEPT